MRSERVNLRLWLNGQSTEQQAYWSSASLLLIGSVANASSLPSINQWSAPCLILGAGALLYGLYTFLVAVLSPIVSSPAGRVVGTAIVVAGSTVSLAAAKVVVNLSLEVPSAAFPYTHTLVALALAPLIVAAASVVVGLLAMWALIPLCFRGPIPMQREPRPLGGRTLAHDGLGVLRFSLILILLAVTAGSLAGSGWYVKQLASFARWFAFHLESEPFSPCSLSEGARAAYLADTEVVVVAERKAESFSFQVQHCSRKP
jgi:hypothetical protein